MSTTKRGNSLLSSLNRKKRGMKAEQIQVPRLINPKRVSIPKQGRVPIKK